MNSGMLPHPALLAGPGRREFSNFFTQANREVFLNLTPLVTETQQLSGTIETLLVSVFIFTLIYIYTGHNKKAITQQFSELLPSSKNNACNYKGEVETPY